MFIDDMDGTLRQIGIGDFVVGKHVGRMMGALGGRLAAFREALAAAALERGGPAQHLPRRAAVGRGASASSPARLRAIRAPRSARTRDGPLLAGRLPP